MYHTPEDIERPSLTGRFYIIKEVIEHNDVVPFVRHSKNREEWLPLEDCDTDINDCWAFTKSGARKAIERYKNKTYKEQYDKGLVKFRLLEQWSY